MRLKHVIQHTLTTLRMNAVSTDEVAENLVYAEFGEIDARSSLEDGTVVETIRTDLTVVYQVVRDGERVRITARQAARRVVDRDFDRKVDASHVARDLGDDAVVRRTVLRWCKNNLCSSVNGTTINLRFRKGTSPPSPSASRSRNTRARTRTIRSNGTEHTVYCDPARMREARRYGLQIRGDMLILSARPHPDDSGILEVQGLRQGRSAEVVTGYLALHPVHDGMFHALYSSSPRGVRALVSKECGSARSFDADRRGNLLRVLTPS